MSNDRKFTDDEIIQLITELDDTELENINEKSLVPLYDEILVSGEGGRIKDRKGNEYLDCTAQAWTVNIGFGNPDIAAVIYEQAKRLTHVRYGFPTIPRIKTINKLLSIAPEGMNKISFNNSGGGAAIEACMKLAMINKPGAEQFLTCFR
ncbi:MAG: aminotransferase class III-fold pyridoxal phosphate-dependent enzyme, partial [Candidatus Hodarchaeales archaeon]